MKKASTWGSIRLRQVVIDLIEEFLESKNTNGLGFSSASQLSEHVLRNYILDSQKEQEIDLLKKEIAELKIKTALVDEQDVRIKNLEEMWLKSKNLI
ncbi:MAG: hypothetical protein HRU07_06775 [Nitrosopumilus sp.]|nr:hypothetical protein [Nitrosopumilus sp.]NRA05842.1 hypothetical protein [Nitrosopumilus sp.]